uniref:Uncharacterized protein n=2 Tax=Glossina pallidipes TaxID=7398 RepID=A0A1A9ZM02_GLOPL
MTKTERVDQEQESTNACKKRHASNSEHRSKINMALVNITNNATVTNTALCNRVYYYNNTSSDSSNVPTLFFRFLGAVIRQVHPLGVVVAAVVVVVVAVVVDEMHKDLYITLQAYRHTNTRLPHLYHFFSFLVYAHTPIRMDKCCVNCNQKADKKRSLPSSDMHA